LDLTLAKRFARRAAGIYRPNGGLIPRDPSLSVGVMSAAQRAALRLLVRQAHANLDQSVAAWLHKVPVARPWTTPVRLYLHALCIEDVTIQSVLRDSVPLFMSFFPNLYGPADVVALRQYARAVYQFTDAYLAVLPGDDLSRVVDLRKLGLGQHSVQWVTRRFVIQELERIACEIAHGADRPSLRLQLVR